MELLEFNLKKNWWFKEVDFSYHYIFLAFLNDQIEAVGIDVVKSDNVVETPQGLSSVCHLGKIWIKPEDMAKKIGIGPRKKWEGN